MKKIVLTLTTLAFLLSININSYANQLRGDDAFYDFKISPSQSIPYIIDTQNTGKYMYHTDAWNNALYKFTQIENTDISFQNTYNLNDVKIQLSSSNSPKEEWVGIAKITHSIANENNPGNLKKSENFLNDYTMTKFNFSKEHIYQVALHELGHTFGLAHQNQEYQLETTMVPYIRSYEKAYTDLKYLDKENMIYRYKKNMSDWENNWANEQIKYAMNVGWVDKSDTFRPGDYISRAEFVKIINRVFELTQKSGIVFSDTSSHWAKDEIDIAVTAKVAVGTEEGKFEPNRTITRQEATKMIANYMKISDTNHDKMKTYPDYNQVADWAKNELEAVIERGYIKGTPEGTLSPLKQLSRAEAVVVLSRIEK